MYFFFVVHILILADIHKSVRSRLGYQTSYMCADSQTYISSPTRCRPLPELSGYKEGSCQNNFCLHGFVSVNVLALKSLSQQKIVRIS